MIGGAFLAVTGGEAFYADMGHFGPFPIRVAWFGVALPALTLNYFGQGGLLLTEPGAIDNPFYQLAPEWSHYGLVALATVATVIASQAIISGAYSLTQQAIQLGFLPRMNIVHTAGHEIGQIYIPFVNWALAAATLAAVIGFGSSDALAGAYGIAVSLLMAITTLMATFVALHWKHNPFLVYARERQPARLDLALFRIDLDEAPGRRLVPVAHRLRHRIPHAHLAQGRGDHGQGPPGGSRDLEGVHRTPQGRPAASHPGHGGRARPHGQGRAAGALAQPQVQSRAARKCVAGRGETTETPRVSDEDRVVVTPISDDITRVELRFGFMEQPDVPKGLEVAVARGQIAKCDLSQVIYYTGHETIIPSGRRSGMARWREELFAFMHHNAQRPGAYFKIPSAQIMEIGVEFEI